MAGALVAVAPAKIALDTFEVLVSSGKVPPKVIRRTVELLREHQDEAIEAFHATREHRFPVTLGSRDNDRD